MKTLTDQLILVASLTGILTFGLSIRPLEAAEPADCAAWNKISRDENGAQQKTQLIVALMKQAFGAKDSWPYPLNDDKVRTDLIAFMLTEMEDFCAVPENMKTSIVVAFAHSAAAVSKKVQASSPGAKSTTSGVSGTNKTSTQIPGSIGNWRIVKSTDPMTDRISCTAFYSTDSQIQLSDTGFFIGLRGRGGVEGVTFRFDDNPARPLRLATEMEKQISVVILSPGEFAELRSSKRLRVQVITVLNSLWQADIDLTGHLDSLEILRGPQCK